jgi:hypothetical protein
MSKLLRKVLSLPEISRRRRIRQKLEEQCDFYYPDRILQPTGWEYVQRVELLLKLADYLILMHVGDVEKRGNNEEWYWINDINQEFPMTY